MSPSGNVLNCNDALNKNKWMYVCHYNIAVRLQKPLNRPPPRMHELAREVL